MGNHVHKATGAWEKLDLRVGLRHTVVYDGVTFKYTISKETKTIDLRHYGGYVEILMEDGEEKFEVDESNSIVGTEYYVNVGDKCLELTYFKGICYLKGLMWDHYLNSKSNQDCPGRREKPRGYVKWILGVLDSMNRSIGVKACFLKDGMASDGKVSGQPIKPAPVNPGTSWYLITQRGYSVYEKEGYVQIPYPRSLEHLERVVAERNATMRKRWDLLNDPKQYEKAVQELSVAKEACEQNKKAVKVSLKADREKLKVKKKEITALRVKYTKLIDKITVLPAEMTDTQPDEAWLPSDVLLVVDDEDVVENVFNKYEEMTFDEYIRLEGKASKRVFRSKSGQTYAMKKKDRSDEVPSLFKWKFVKLGVIMADSQDDMDYMVNYRRNFRVRDQLDMAVKQWTNKLESCAKFDKMAGYLVDADKQQQNRQITTIREAIGYIWKDFLKRDLPVKVRRRVAPKGEVIQPYTQLSNTMKSALRELYEILLVGVQSDYFTTPRAGVSNTQSGLKIYEIGNHKVDVVMEFTNGAAEEKGESVKRHRKSTQHKQDVTNVYPELKIKMWKDHSKSRRGLAKKRKRSTNKNGSGPPVVKSRRHSQQSSAGRDARKGQPSKGKRRSAHKSKKYSNKSSKHSRGHYLNKKGRKAACGGPSRGGW